MLLQLASDLIRCPSVTPHSAGVMDVLEAALRPLGFEVHRVVFSGDGEQDTENLYARLGTQGPNFCFAGHTDVVPAGDEAAWSHPPFEPVVKDGTLYGRGTQDMKGAIAAFVAAVERVVSPHPTLSPGRGLEMNPLPGERVATAGEGKTLRGSISLLITNDEEGTAINGTQKMLRWLAERGEKIDHCLVGEPTNPTFLGEMAKPGRRGSLTCELTVRGKQGHVAYPERANNPVTRLIAILHEFTSHPLDAGNEFFPPSNLEVTSIDVGNPTTNVIPARASARFNIRYNNEQTGEKLERWLHEVCTQKMADYELRCRHSGDAFLTRDEKLTTLLVNAVKQVTGHTPALATTGGTSDARFIKDVCPVIEFGTTGDRAHMVDECVEVAVLEQLAAVYEAVLRGYFA